MPGSLGPGRCVAKAGQGPEYRHDEKRNRLANHTACQELDVARRCQSEAARSFLDMMLLGMTDIFVQTKWSTFAIVPEVMAFARGVPVCEVHRGQRKMDQVAYTCFDLTTATDGVGAGARAQTSTPMDGEGGEAYQGGWEGEDGVHYGMRMRTVRTGTSMGDSGLSVAS